MDGTKTVKGYSGFTVNEALLAKIVEALKKGEADARRYSQTRSFEIYYDGFRQRMLFGRIMIIPAKLADSFEDFPSALLYGAIVKELTPEVQADLYSHKLGDSEFDEYSKKDLAAIKDKLFKDDQNRYRSIVMFIPTWANPRDYVVFKYVTDPELLTRMVRQQIYGCYFNPALSSAFDHLSDDTEKMNVSEISPKINYPGLAEGLEKLFPLLEDDVVDPKKVGIEWPVLDYAEGAEGSKTAAARKPRMLFAADTSVNIEEEFLEPGEKAVIDSLAEELRGKINGEITSPKEAAVKSANKLIKYTPGLKILNTDHLARGTGAKYLECIEDHAGNLIASEWRLKKPENYDVLVAFKGSPEYSKLPDGKEAALDGVNLKTLGDSPSGEAGSGPSISPKGPSTAAPKAPAVKAPASPAKQSSKDDEGATTGLRSQPDYGESDSETSKANAMAEKGAKKAAEKPVLTIWGSCLFQRKEGLVAKAASGYTETLRVNGTQIRWIRPNQFANAFKAAAVNYIRNPRNNAVKLADVPQTFDEIWKEIAEEMGPAPIVKTKEPGKRKSEAPESDESVKAPAEAKPATEPADTPESTEPPADKTEDKSDKKPAFLKDKESKRAAFNMFIPGQVLKEFYPEVQRETVEYPSDSFTPSQVEPDGKTLAGDPAINTDPAAAMGIGQDGKPQILEGAPLRREQDVRGYAFDQEFYAQSEGLDPRSLYAAYALVPIKKNANKEEFKAQFADFLKRAMGEIAATFIGGFKATSKPPMNRVPGTGEIKLDMIEQNSAMVPNGTFSMSSRVKFLMSKLTDSEIQDALNGAWSQSAVYNTDMNGGYLYEVFVRPESIDKDTMTMSYSFVVGTKGI